MKEVMTQKKRLMHTTRHKLSRTEKLKRLEQKSVTDLENSENIVSIYQWFYVLVLCCIPVINIFLLIYCGFASNRTNRNIKNLCIAGLLLTGAISILLLCTYLSIQYILDSQSANIVIDFYNGLYDSFNQLFRQLKQLFFN